MNKGVIGINKLQEAFEDRFIITPEISYPLKSKEIDIASQISGCKKKIAEIVVDAARQIRKQAIQDYSITKIFSIDRGSKLTYTIQATNRKRLHLQRKYYLKLYKVDISA